MEWLHLIQMSHEDKVIHLLKKIHEQGETIMANVTDLANQVATLQATESARDARDAAIIAALKALPNGVLNPADQAVLDKAVADLGTLNTAIGSQDNS